MRLLADLHLHSCLSPCGDLSMSPRDIVRIAVEKGFDVITLTDHNSALNTPAMQVLCAHAGLVFIPGLEVTTVEEAHVLALFDNVQAALDFSGMLQLHLPHLPSNPERFGDQVYVNENDEILGEVEYYLGVGVQFSLDELAIEIHRFGGLFVPAHIERDMYSLTSQLGFIPEADYDALELSRNYHLREHPVIEQFLKDHEVPLVCGSDAHYLDDIGRAGTFIECQKGSARDVLDAIRLGHCSPVFRHT